MENQIKIEDIKPGVAVNYYAVIKDDGRRIGKIETEITSNLITLSSGEKCCHIKRRVGLVSINNLELR